MRFTLALFLSLLAVPGAGHGQQRSPGAAPQREQAPPPLNNPPRLWGEPMSGFADRFNAVARQLNLPVRAVMGGCQSQRKTSCDIRIGALPGSVLGANEGRPTEEFIVGIAATGDSVVDGLQVTTVMLRWAAPRADAGEYRAAFSALFPSGGGGTEPREARLNGTRFSLVALPGMGMFLTAGRDAP